MTFGINHWWVGFFTYLPFHLLHVFVWRRYPPRREIFDLGLYLLLLPLSLGLIFVGLGGSLPWSAALLHSLLAVNYIAIYPAFQASSPTVHVLCLLLQHPLGLTPSEVEGEVKQVTRITDRIEDLSRSRLLIPRGRGWALSPAGRALARFFTAYRAFLGLEEGAG